MRRAPVRARRGAANVTAALAMAACNHGGDTLQPDFAGIVAIGDDRGMYVECRAPACRSPHLVR